MAYASNMVKYNVFPFYPLPRTGKWVSVALSFSPICALFVWMEIDCAFGLSLIVKPSQDLWGLISLDNKTKRLNVLIVADGARFLAKCVKLVLTSLHLAVIFHPYSPPQTFYHSLLPHTPLHSSGDPVPGFPVLLYIQIDTQTRYRLLA